MKKFTILFASISICILLISCSKDEKNEEPVIESSIIGQWTLTDIYTENGRAVAMGIPADFSAVGKDYNVKLTFTENPNNMTSIGNFTAAITMTILGNPVSKDIPGNAFLEDGSWNLNDPDLTITADGQSIPNEILLLDETTLRIKSDFSEEIEIDGVPTQITGTYFATLNRN